MSNKGPKEHGADAPQVPVDADLQDAVAGLLQLSHEDRENLERYDVASCDDQLQELVDYIYHSTGKPSRTIGDVVGRIFLLYQRKTQLQRADDRELISELNRAVTSLQQEVAELKEQSEEDPHGPRREEERKVKQEEGQAAQVSTPPDLPDLTDLSDLETVPPTEPRRPMLRERLLRSEESDHRRYQALPSARPLEREAPPQKWSYSQRDESPRRSVSYLPRGRSPTGDSRPPRAYDRHSSRESRTPRTPTPPRGRRSHPVRYSYHGDYGSSSESDGPYPAPRQGLRTRQLESLAKDIERYDPTHKEADIEGYLREIDHCLRDLPHASAREKLKLVWKTSTRHVHSFIETLAPEIRDRYSRLREALHEEYGRYRDPASATLGALAVLHRKQEPPREYYRRFRAAYAQGRNSPGVEEESAFKALFLHNLHESVRYDVTMYCRTHQPSMQEIRNFAQMSWETRVRPGRAPENDARVLGIQTPGQPALGLEGDEVPQPKVSTRPARQAHREPNPQQWRQNQGGERNSRPWNNTRPRHENRPRNKVQFERKQEGKHNAWATNPRKRGGAEVDELAEVLMKTLRRLRQPQQPQSSQPPPSSPQKPDKDPDTKPPPL